jgi:hypothetical protein
VLLAVLVALGALALVGGVGAVLLYDRATAIDRSTPAAAARQFLHAALVENDAHQVGLHVCDGWAAQTALNETAVELGPSSHVSWAIGATEHSGADRATVAVRVQISTGAGGLVADRIEQWTLRAVDQRGWRICGIEK